MADTGDSDSDGMCESLLRMGAVEALLEGCLCAHEPTQLEVTRVVRAMAAQSYVADMLVRHDLTFAHMKPMLLYGLAVTAPHAWNGAESLPVSHSALPASSPADVVVPVHWPFQ